MLASGRHCVLVIDVQGAATLRRDGVEAAHELDEAASFDHRVVNADLEAASRAVAHLLGVELAPLAL